MARANLIKPSMHRPSDNESRIKMRQLIVGKCGNFGSPSHVATLSGNIPGSFIRTNKYIFQQELPVRKQIRPRPSGFVLN